MYSLNNGDLVLPKTEVKLYRKMVGCFFLKKHQIAQFEDVWECNGHEANTLCDLAIKLGY